MAEKITTQVHTNGGRVLLLFLLFLVAIYELVTTGLPAFAVVCISPIFIAAVYVMFRWKMSVFWFLFFVNYIIQMKGVELPVPTSLPNEMLQLLLIGIAIIDAREEPHFGRAMNLMLFSLLIWAGLCMIELLNDTCGLGINFAAWYGLTRMMCLQIIYIMIVFSLYISSPEILRKYLYVWAAFALFSVFWVWRQKTFGFNTAENIWMETRGRATHILQGGTLIRYFSTFGDAANYGCNAAATAVTFIIVAITTKLKRDKIFFALTAVAVIWGMFQSGTRTAIFCLAAGLMTYVVLSKSFKIAIPFAITLAFFAVILIFTNIGQGNQQIRRMRSAFNKNDASASVRDINQEAIRKYIADAPWGIGFLDGWGDIPANNKYRKLSTIPPDSEYVFIWVHSGPIGITVFLITTAMMFLGACRIVFFRLKSPSLIGIGASFCSAFVAIQLGGYANQVLMQFPNCLLFYGGLSIVYILPYLESDWIKHEEKLLAEQEEKKRLKLEKKLASRV
jgi:hypothetical protein